MSHAGAGDSAAIHVWQLFQQGRCRAALGPLPNLHAGIRGSKAAAAAGRGGRPAGALTEL